VYFVRSSEYRDFRDERHLEREEERHRDWEWGR
jgi:hypothetical protein